MQNKLLLILIMLITLISGVILCQAYQETLDTYSESKEVISSQQYKRNLMIQMYNAARERSFMLLKMIGVDDPFE